MNKKEILKNLYRQNISLELKNRILKFLINKITIIGLSDIDFKLETILNENKIFPSRYARGYYAAFYEI